MKTRVTELFGIRYPIVQGGLQHLALPGLCAAVSSAGGLGQLTAAAFATPEKLREGIEETRSLTTAPFGVNFAIGYTPLEDHLTAALEAGITTFSFTGGNPEPFLKRLAGRDVRTIVLVAAVRQAKKAESLGASAVIAVGFEGGGHIGRDDVGTLVLVPRVVDSVKIPVLASGGIGDARGLVAALALGADGIEMGTRFVATQECLAHPAYKQALVEAGETDTVLIKRSIGQPGRVLSGPWAEQILGMERRGASAEELRPLVRGEVNRRAAREGDLEHGYAWAGQVTGLIDDVPTVKELIQRLVRGAKSITDGLCCLSD
jgi:NAD(P)H-dependent flavin oxidoreductase YrpB (nitropropane dioxygenase family)